MENIEMEFKKEILIIKIDTSKNLGKSKSGKTDIVATTSGNMDVSLPDGTVMKLGINAYKYPKNP